MVDRRLRLHRGISPVQLLIIQLYRDWLASHEAVIEVRHLSLRTIEMLSLPPDAVADNPRLLDPPQPSLYFDAWFRNFRRFKQDCDEPKLSTKSSTSSQLAVDDKGMRNDALFPNSRHD